MEQEVESVEWRVEWREESVGSGEWSIFIMCSAYGLVRVAFSLRDLRDMCLRSGSWLLPVFDKFAFLLSHQAGAWLKAWRLGRTWLQNEKTAALSIPTNYATGLR